MITRMIDYKCDNIPTDDDLKQALRVAYLEKCIVRLHWKSNYYGSVVLSITDDMSLADCKRSITKKYTKQMI